MDSRENVFQDALETLRIEVGCDFCALGLLDPESRILRWLWASGNSNEKFRQIEDKPGRGFHRSVVKIGRGMLLLADELHASRQLQEFPLLISEWLASAYAVPVWQDTQVAGVLLAGDRVKRDYPPEVRNRIVQSGERLSAWLREDANGSQSV